MEPRLKWNKIILADKIILFHFRRVSLLNKTLKFFKILTWNHAFRHWFICLLYLGFALIVDTDAGEMASSL